MELTFKDKFDISNYGGKAKLFKVDPINLEYSLDLPVDAVSPEGKEVQKLVKADWEKQMKLFKAAKEKEYKEAIAFTETAVLKSIEKRRVEIQKKASRDEQLKLVEGWIETEKETARVMINNATETFKLVVKKYMETLWVKLSAAIDKKFKTQISKKKALAVLKIIGLVVLAVAVGAASIAIGVIGLVAAAHTGGVSVLAAVAVAGAGIVTIAATAKKIVDVYSANWPTHKRSAKLLEEKTKALMDAMAYEKVKLEKVADKKKLGPKEKIKLMLGNVKGKKEDLAKAIKDTQTWTMVMRQDIEKSAKTDQEMKVKLEGIKKDLLKEKDNKKLQELNVAVLAYEKHLNDTYPLTNARNYLAKYSELLDAAENVLKDETNFSESKFGETVDKLSKFAASDEVGVLVEAGKTGAKLLAAVFKLLKALKP